MFSMCYIISAPGIFDIVGYLFMLPERFVSGILVTRKENYTTLWGHQAILEQNNQIPPWKIYFSQGQSEGNKEDEYYKTSVQEEAGRKETWYPG